MKLKKVFFEALDMCPFAWELVSKTAVLALVMSLCALSMSIHGEETGLSPQLLHITYGLAEVPAGLFLIGSIGAMFLQSAYDRH